MIATRVVYENEISEFRGESRARNSFAGQSFQSVLHSNLSCRALGLGRACLRKLGSPVYF